MKITLEIEEQTEQSRLIALQATRMRSSIEVASDMLVDMMNYGPNVWEKTENELQDVVDILNVFLLEDK